MKDLIKKALLGSGSQSDYALSFMSNQEQYKAYEIGEFTYGSPTVLHWGEESTLKIGKFCSVASNVTILLGGNHRLDWVTTYPFSVLNKDFPSARNLKGHPATKGNVIIGNDVWIGLGATILSGVNIGSGAVIAAESVVTKNVEPYEIVGGNPARVIRKRFSDEIIKKLLSINWWNWPPREIENAVHYLCSERIEDFIDLFYKKE